MHRSRFPIAAAAVACLLFPPAAKADDASFARFADSLFAAQMKKQSVPGAVFVVVRDGRVAYARGYGFADLERRVPVDAERTVFRVASVSKLVTATAALQLVERGRLDLHADVNRYLKRFQIRQTFGRPITLVDLLTHTSGLDDGNVARKAWRAADVEPLGEYLARRLPARIRPPGERIAYSNHGMALAGYLVEVASGMPFERYVEQNVFAPLGMTHSSFALVPDSVGSLAVGYEGAPPEPQSIDYTRTRPASMLSTSGADMGRFLIAHLEGGLVDGRRVLDEASVDAMHRRQFSQHPMLDGIGFGFWERTIGGERVLWHDGDAAGFASLLGLVPARRFGVFMAFNSRGGGDARAEILDALFAREFPRVNDTPSSRDDSLSAAIAAIGQGTYVDTRHAHSTLDKLVSLTRQVVVGKGAKGALTFGGARYLPIGAEVFEREDGDGRLTFGASADGRVAYLFTARSIARAFERVPWYGTPGVQIGWLLLCVLGFTAHLIGSAVRVFRNRGRARDASLPDVVARRIGRTLIAVSAANLVSLVGLALAIAGVFGSLEYLVPPALPALLTLPLLAGGATIVCLAVYVRAGIGSRTGGAGLVPALAIACSLASLSWLAYWNLLGYRW